MLSTRLSSRSMCKGLLPMRKGGKILMGDEHIEGGCMDGMHKLLDRSSSTNSLYGFLIGVS